METALLEQKIEKTADNVQNLTVTVTKLAGIVENHEHRYGNIEKSIETMAGGIKEITANLGQITSLSKDVRQNEKDISGLREDIRTCQHDVRNIQNSVVVLTLHDKEIALLKTKVEDMQVRNTKQDGAGLVVRFLWVTFGTAILGLLGWLIFSFTTHNYASRNTLTTTETQR